MRKLSIILTSVVVVVLGLYLSGCATISKGTSQLVTINCNVDGATIKLDGKKIGKTPFIGKISKGHKFFTIKKDGYKTYRIALNTSLEPMFWGNFISTYGSTIGSITDYVSGAAFQYSPANYQVELYAKDISLNEFKEIFELRKFAMVNMSNIAIDISNNAGSYLESVVYLSNLNNNKKSTEIIREKLIASDGDQVVFGNLMVELLNAES